MTRTAKSAGPGTAGYGSGQDSDAVAIPGPRLVSGERISSTPMPQLVTVGPTEQVVPKLVTAITMICRPQPGCHSPSTPGVSNRPHEQLGDRASGEEWGRFSLFPALVVGVGSLGQLVVDSLHKSDPRSIWPSGPGAERRFLCLDTELDSGSLSGAPVDLIRKEVVLGEVEPTGPLPPTGEFDAGRPVAAARSALQDSAQPRLGGWHAGIRAARPVR